MNAIQLYDYHPTCPHCAWVMPEPVLDDPYSEWEATCPNGHTTTFQLEETDDEGRTMNKSTKKLTATQRARREELLSTLDDLYLSLEEAQEDLDANEDAACDYYDEVTVDALRRCVDSHNLALSEWITEHGAELAELGIDPADPADPEED